MTAHQKSAVVAVTDDEPFGIDRPQNDDGRRGLDDIAGLQGSGDQQSRPTLDVRIENTTGHGQVAQRHDATEAASERLGIGFQDEVVLDQGAWSQNQGLLLGMIDEDLLDPVTKGSAPLQVSRRDQSGEMPGHLVEWLWLPQILKLCHAPNPYAWPLGADSR